MKRSDQSLLEIDVDSDLGHDPKKWPNYTIDALPALNLTGKKYKDFDLEEFKIPWVGSRERLWDTTIDKSKRK